MKAEEVATRIEILKVETSIVQGSIYIIYRTTVSYIEASVKRFKQYSPKSKFGHWELVRHSSHPISKLIKTQVFESTVLDQNTVKLLSNEQYWKAWKWIDGFTPKKHNSNVKIS